MKKDDLLVNTKKEIRSVLLPEQNGLPLRQFCRRYKNLLGSDLPYKELGFNNVCNFLKSIDGEVVDLVWSHNHNDYHVKGIPDETTKHIDKLVQKQKPSFHSLENACSAWSRVTYRRPPRFSRNPYTWKSSNVNNIDKIEPICDSGHAFSSISFHEMKQRIIDIVKDHPDGINYKDLTLNYEEKFDVPFDFKIYDCQSLAECLEQISTLQSKKVDGVMKVFLNSHSTNSYQELPSENSVRKDAIYNWLESNQASENHPSTSPELNQKHTDLIPADFENNYSEHDDDSDIYEHQVGQTLEEKFKEILQRNPRGIFSKDFESSFKAFYGYNLNLPEIGYQNFLELVDALPNVFTKLNSGVSGNDCLLFSASSTKNDNSLPTIISPGTKREENRKEIKQPLNLEDVAIAVRRLLLGYNAVLFVDEFKKLYEVNTKTPFNVEDMGFNDLIEFFQAIEERVPLKLDYSNVRTKVCLKYCATPEPSEESIIPFDSVLCDQTFTIQDLPVIKDEKYFKMYIGTVINPDLIYIQLKGTSTSIALEKLSNQLQLAYARNSDNGLHGEKYRMQPQDIVINAPCAAIYSVDYLWYRAKITHIEETKIKVLFVDYGNEECVTKENLRYLKKDHFELPAQAIPVGLAFVTLAPDQREWSKTVASRIISLCAEKILMGKVIEYELHPESTFVHIVDTNCPTGQIDISELLIKENFAVYWDGKSKSTSINYERSQSSQIFNPTENNGVEFITNEVPNQAMVKQALDTIRKFQNAPQISNIPPFSIVNPPVFNVPLPPVLTQQFPSTLKPTNQMYAPQFSQFPNMVPHHILSPNFLSSDLPPENSLSSSMLYKNPASFFTPIQNQMPIFPTFQNQQVNAAPLQNGVKLKPSHYIPNNNSNSVLPVSSDSINEYLASSNAIFRLSNDALEHSSSNIPPPVEKVPIENRSFSNENNNQSDMFPDDDEEAFLEICKEYEGVQKHVKRLYLKCGYKIHVILLNNVIYVSSYDIIKLFWPNESRPVLQRRLRQCDIWLDCKVIYQKDYEQIFAELRRFHVKGSESTDGERISLYLLDDVLLILNAFGHSSSSIRFEIRQIVKNFNSKSWQSTFANEEEEQETTLADSFKLERLCLYDLTAIYEGLKYKRLKALKSLNTNEKHQGLIISEINSYEEKMTLYRQRIIQVEALCNKIFHKFDFQT